MCGVEVLAYLRQCLLGRWGTEVPQPQQAANSCLDVGGTGALPLTTTGRAEVPPQEQALSVSIPACGHFVSARIAAAAAITTRLSLQRWLSP